MIEPATAGLVMFDMMKRYDMIDMCELAGLCVALALRRILRRILKDE